MQSRTMYLLAVAITALLTGTSPIGAQEKKLHKELGRLFGAAKDRTTQIVENKADEMEGRVTAERLRDGASSADRPAVSPPQKGEAPKGTPSAERDGDALPPRVHQVTRVPREEMSAILVAAKGRDWLRLLPLLREVTGYDSVLAIHYEKAVAEITDQEARLRKTKVDLERDITVRSVFEEDTPARQQIEIRIQQTQQAMARTKDLIERLVPERERLLQAACRDYLHKHLGSWTIAADH